MARRPKAKALGYQPGPFEGLVVVGSGGGATPLMPQVRGHEWATQNVLWVGHPRVDVKPCPFEERTFSAASEAVPLRRGDLIRGLPVALQRDDID